MRLALLLTCLCTVPLAAAESPGPGVRWQPLNEPGAGGYMVGIAVSPHDGQRILLSGDMLGVGLSTDGGDSWLPTFGFKAWETADITWHPTDPQVVWIGSMSGPYVSRDGGTTWQERRAGMPEPTAHRYTAPIEVVLIDPRDDQRLLAMGGSSRNWSAHGAPAWGAVWESRDGGDSWTWLSTVTHAGSGEVGTPGDNIRAAQFDRHDPDTVYALTSRALLVSTDGAVTWHQRGKGLLAGANLNRLAQHPTRPGRLWVSVGNAANPDGGARLPGGVYRSDDHGATFVETSAGIRAVVTGTDTNLTTAINGLAVAPSDGDRLYCNDGSWRTGITYRSDDGGDTWRPVVSKGNLGQEDAEPEDKQQIPQIVTACPAGNSMAVISVDPRNADAVYAINTEFIARSRDGGATWDDASAIAAGDGRWRGRGYAGWCAINVVFDRFRAGRVSLHAMDAGQCWLSADGAQSWSYHHSPETPWSGGTDASYTADGRLYVTTGSHGWMGIGRRDADGTWQWFRGAAHGLPAAAWGKHSPAGIHAHAQRGDRVWAVVGGVLYHSTNAGERWQVIDGVPQAYWIADDPRDADRIYITSRRGVLRWDDGALTALGGPRGGRVCVDAQGRVLVSSHQGERPGLWRYADGTWTRLFDDHWTYGVAVDPDHAERIVVTTNQNPYVDHCQASGIWVSHDDGASWSVQNEGLAMLRGLCVAFDPHAGERLIFGSMGRGYFTATWPRTYQPAGTRRYTHDAEDSAWAAVRDPRDLSVRNGTMSRADGDRVAEWTQTWTGSGQLATARDTAMFVSPPASLRLRTIDGAAKGTVGQSLTDVGSGRETRVRGNVRSHGAVKVNVGAQCFSSDWTAMEYIQLAYVEGDRDWTAFEKTFTTPAGTAHVIINLLVEGDGTAWLDDVR